jgi:glutathione S-transferase
MHIDLSIWKQRHHNGERKMALEFLGFDRSNFVRAVRMAAHEKGVDYELVQALPQSDELKAINPFGQMPAMRHDDVELAESSAIIRYLDNTFDGPALIPAEPVAAAKTDQWMSAVATTVDRLIMRQYVVEYVFHKDEDGNVVRDEIDKSAKRLPGMYKRLDAAVAPGYLGSAEFTAADCLLAPIIAVANNFPEAKERFEASPNLQAYLSRIADRESFKATQPG